MRKASIAILKFFRPSLADVDFFWLKALVVFGTAQHKRYRVGGSSPVHAGNDVRAVHPMGLGEVGCGVPRRMVGMRMVKPNDVLPARARQLHGRDHLLRIDAVLALRRIGALIVTGNGESDSLASIADAS